MSENTLQLRPSRVLAKMRAGGVAVSAKSNLTDPRVTEIMALCGFDCVWHCMEHVPNSIHDIENCVRAAAMYDVDSVVRVRRGSYSDHVLPLEMNATGIMVPHIMSLEDAKKVVWNTRFHPIGRRAWDGGNADGAYCMIPPLDYIEQANRERFVIVQIEDPEVLDDLEEIAKLDGIDCIFYGAGDFSQGIGHPAEFDHPKITDTRKRIADVCKKYGKFAGAMASTGNFQEMVDMGYQFLNVGADVVGLGDYFRSLMSELGLKPNQPAQTIYRGKEA